MSRFDEFAPDYDSALDLGISVSGESKQYFARGRVDWLRRRLHELDMKPAGIFDFGCGTGTSIPYLLELPGAMRVLGIDDSSRSLEIARKHLDPQKVQLLSL